MADGIKVEVRQESGQDFVEVRVCAFAYRIHMPIKSRYDGEEIGWDATMEQMRQARMAADQVSAAVHNAILDAVYPYLRARPPGSPPR